MHIVAMLRVKNEGRWLAEVLASIQPLTEDILLFDDHSTDDTREIAAAHGCTVVRSVFEGINEVRDKNYMLDVVDTMDPDYVLAIDGDEVLEAGAADKIRARLRPELSSYTFPIRYIWNDRQHYRTDGVYGRYFRASLFALANQPEVSFRGTGRGGNFHCGNVPLGLKGAGGSIPANILHLGYMHEEDRVRKYHWYNMIDPNNHAEDCYRHMVIGDIYPADSKFTHGGPLKIFPLPSPAL
jgi:glycosyltransferase involved in cell wall biosynthesis